MNNQRRDLLKFSPLALAAFIPSLATGQTSGAPPVASPMFFDVRTYGATGTGKSLDTPGVNAAIAAASAAGGGTVVFPAGTYLCFSIRLKSNVHLYLSQGAVILAAESPKPGETTGQMGGVYDAAEPVTSYDAYQDYGHNHWHNSLIWGEGIENVSITGPGLIYGKGLSYGAARAPRGDYPVYRAEQAGVGNKAIAMKNCRNVTFKEFRLLKGGHFGLLLTGVDNLVIDGLLIDTDRDGMDIDCCKNVHVSNCTVNSPWDDGICPKSSYALGYARATENVTITGCTVSGNYMLGTVLDGTYKHFAADAPMVYRTGRIKCGTESNGGFKNISISNCVFDGCNSLSLESEDGALCEDIAISNITMRDLISGPLFFRLGARLRGPKPETKVGTLRRIVVQNITSYNSDATLCNILSGIPDFPIEDIKISNFYMQHKGGASAEKARIMPPEEVEKYPDPAMFGPMPAGGFFLRHVRHLEMSHVEIQPMSNDARPSFVLEDVTRADFFAVTAPTPNAFDLRHVKDVRVGWSRATKDAVIADAAGRML
ncbi:endopolygalacturonase [Terriglobus roseus DSM 18391]|uniref:Endopolygalacturonase n=1 Tax=Terriglobus roseus (strain DSM 18391 / NRRL B-41598 / KBS 63) TaxID=926566 RepID=I3ZIA6_TERRK|nr:glycosyl hydrolase family 28-related protein [Terriglobus roseus]AFL88974.1 endopolygalacturonase [Terriglobus roseus DSM 18391]